MSEVNDDQSIKVTVHDGRVPYKIGGLYDVIHYGCSITKFPVKMFF